MELFEKFGFKANPFSTFSAEDEKEFLNKIYLNPRFYNTLKSDISNGHSRFILGARGIGKTALISQLSDEISSEGSFAVIVDDFDGIPKKNNQAYLLKLIIESLVTNYCFAIAQNPKALKKLNKFEKEKLSYFIRDFFQTLSKSEYENYYNKANKYQTRNFFRNIWNYFINRPLNFVISGSIEVAGEAVRKAMGLPSHEGVEFYKNYLPEIPLEEIQKKSDLERLLNNVKPLKTILEDLSKIIDNSGFGKPIVFFDKIDEYTSLNSSVSAISDFLQDFLRDTTILMNKSYCLVFSLWSALKPELTNLGVRFDKIKPIDITWQPEDLLKIINRRISFFSRNTKRIDDLIKDESSISSIIELSNCSPRYLFRQLSVIYDVQSESNSEQQFFTKKAISQGQLIYAKNFEYYAIYPSKRGSKDDILKNVNRLLRIGKEVIMTKDFVEIFKVSTPAAMSYIKILHEYNLIQEMTETEGRAKMYNVVDPVIVHLIRHGIPELKK